MSLGTLQATNLIEVVGKECPVAAGVMPPQALPPIVS